MDSHSTSSAFAGSSSILETWSSRSSSTFQIQQKSPSSATTRSLLITSIFACTATNQQSLSLLMSMTPRDQRYASLVNTGICQWPHQSRAHQHHLPHGMRSSGTSTTSHHGEASSTQMLSCTSMHPQPSGTTSHVRQHLSKMTTTVASWQVAQATLQPSRTTPTIRFRPRTRDPAIPQARNRSSASSDIRSQ